MCLRIHVQSRDSLVSQFLLPTALSKVLCDCFQVPEERNRVEISTRGMTKGLEGTISALSDLYLALQRNCLILKRETRMEDTETNILNLHPSHLASVGGKDKEVEEKATRKTTGKRGSSDTTLQKQQIQTRELLNVCFVKIG